MNIPASYFGFLLQLCVLVVLCMFPKVADQDYEKEKLNERIAKLSGGVAIIQVWF